MEEVRTILLFIKVEFIIDYYQRPYPQIRLFNSPQANTSLQRPEFSSRYREVVVVRRFQ